MFLIYSVILLIESSPKFVGLVVFIVGALHGAKEGDPDAAAMTN